MFLSRMKAAAVWSLVLGLLGLGAGWLMTVPGASGTAARVANGEAAPPAKDVDKKAAAKGAAPLAKARADLRHAAAEADKVDEEWAEKVIEARERLVELEERLRDAEDARVAARGPSAEETQLKAVATLYDSKIAQAREVSVRGKEGPKARELEKQAAEVTKKLKALEDRKAVQREKATVAVVKARREVLRQEEKVRVLERKRASTWAEAEARREDLAERVRRLEGAAAEGADRQQRALKRTLDGIERELGELRREVRRLRPAGKK